MYSTSRLIKGIVPPDNKASTQVIAGKVCILVYSSCKEVGAPAGGDEGTVVVDIAAVADT
jgi:hypothetical protein